MKKLFHILLLVVLIYCGIKFLLPAIGERLPESSEKEEINEQIGIVVEKTDKVAGTVGKTARKAADAVADTAQKVSDLFIDKVADKVADKLADSETD